MFLPAFSGFFSRIYVAEQVAKQADVGFYPLSAVSSAEYRVLKLLVEELKGFYPLSAVSSAE